MTQRQTISWNHVHSTDALFVRDYIKKKSVGNRIRSDTALDAQGNVRGRLRGDH